MTRSHLAALFLLAACNGGKADSASPIDPTPTTGTPPTNSAGPTASNDLATVDEGASVNLDVVDNDLVTANPIDLASVAIAGQPAYGTASVAPDGTIDYSHDGGESTSDSFSYTVADTAGTPSNSATVTVSINPVNDAPVAVDDSAAGQAGTVLNIAVLANDTDVDNALNPASVFLVSPASAGILTVQPDGSVNYAHNGSGTLADSFTYQVDDMAGATSNAATVSISLTPAANQPPLAVDDGDFVVEGGMVNIDLVANDTDPDDGIDVATVTITVPPTSGSVFVLVDGSVDYTHDGSETLADSFVYTVSDYAGAVSNPATVLIPVSPVNDPPVAVDDNFAADEGATTPLAVLANDTDVDDALDPASIVILSPPTNGTATPQPGGTVDYAHDGSETTSDSFSYTVSDASGAPSNIATVNLTVNPVNDLPVAQDDAALVTQGGAVNIDVSGNDSDVEGLDLGSIQIVSPPTGGAATPLGNGTVDYVHFGGASNFDSFTYTIDDSAGATSNLATVDITVNILTTPPTANDNLAHVPTEVWTTLSPIADDFAFNYTGLDPATLVITSPPFNGTAILNGDGTVDYLHDWTSGVMSDSFSYTVRDTTGAVSNVASFDIVVDAPSRCAAVFETAWDLHGQGADPTLYYGATYGLSFSDPSVIPAGGLLGGMGNGDPGNWDVEGTNGTSAWGMWYGTPAIDFAEPVVDVSVDFIRAAADQSFVVDAYLGGTWMDSAAVSLVGPWTAQTVSFAGPVDRIEWSFAANFLGVDDVRYSAPTLPCPSRVVDHTPTTGIYYDSTAAPFYAVKGYSFTPRETFSITGGAYWLDLPTGGLVRMTVYDATTQAVLGSGTNAAGLGLERWYHSELDFTFAAGTTYVVGFYTDRAGTAIFDRMEGAAFPFDVDALIDVHGSWASTTSGDFAAEVFPTSGNSWTPFQRLVRTPETVDNLGWKIGTGDFSCPPSWRLPNGGEYDTLTPWLLPTDLLGYYENIALSPGPDGCYCKWNDSYCGQPSVETFDGRMCGDFAQLHMCVEDR